MLHSRIFLEDPGYREEHFTTCEDDRCTNPLTHASIVVMAPSCR